MLWWSRDLLANSALLQGEPRSVSEYWGAVANRDLVSRGRGERRKSMLLHRSRLRPGWRGSSANLTPTKHESALRRRSRKENWKAVRRASKLTATLAARYSNILKSSTMEVDFPALKPADLEILLALSERDRHGYGLMKEVERQSDGRVVLELGSLYRLISRLERDGMIQSLDNGPTEPDGSTRSVAGATND